MPTLITVPQLAKLLSCSAGSIYTRLSRGQIPASCIVRLGNRIRFDEAAVGRWLESLRGAEG